MSDINTESGWANGLFVSSEALSDEIAEPLLLGMRILEPKRKENGLDWSREAAKVRALAQAAWTRHQSKSVVADAVGPSVEALSSPTMGEETRRTVTPTEVARRFGIERQGVLGRLKRGTLPGTQDDLSHWHIEIEAVERAYGRRWDDEDGRSTEVAGTD